MLKWESGSRNGMGNRDYVIGILHNLTWQTPLLKLIRYTDTHGQDQEVRIDINKTVLVKQKFRNQVMNCKTTRCKFCFRPQLSDNEV